MSGARSRHCGRTRWKKKTSRGRSTRCVPAWRRAAARRSSWKEGITNAIRHGHATRVQVRCHIEDGVLEVSVRDNGIGCKSVTPGFGLQHMQERMLMLGGTFWYENSDGFCIRAEIPLRKTPGSEKRKQEETV